MLRQSKRIYIFQAGFSSAMIIHNNKAGFIAEPAPLGSLLKLSIV